MQPSTVSPASPPSLVSPESDAWLEVATLAHRHRLVRAALVCVDLALPHADRHIAALEQARDACAAWLEGKAPWARERHLVRLEEQLRWAETVAIQAYKTKFDAIFGWDHGNSFAASERADRVQTGALVVESVLWAVRALGGSLEEAELALRFCARRAVDAVALASHGPRSSQAKTKARMFLWERIEPAVAARCLDPV